MRSVIGSAAAPPAGRRNDETSMSQRSLLESVLELCERLSGRAVSPGERPAVVEIVDGNGSVQQAPAWLLELFDALLDGSAFPDRNIDFDLYCGPRYDVPNFLAELVLLREIPHVNVGEFQVISFDPLGVSVCIDGEARDGGVDVRVMPHPADGGPYLERWPPKRP